MSTMAATAWRSPDTATVEEALTTDSSSQPPVVAISALASCSPMPSAATA
ncbi:Uncharacterised protein [Mycobacterium tuberculosis]|uniref:Uncharacterized protein n=1 Tax=Mycobacterium tuberculosis TaxID=1773 RepID=A0A655JE74_MYCTX|nr:Uncharacterised protein [Mycobacterium tuberculosis]COW78917.1 Uncharacterised protein [Mycobacterium tuberculosis]